MRMDEFQIDWTELLVFCCDCASAVSALSQLDCLVSSGSPTLRNVAECQRERWELDLNPRQHVHFGEEHKAQYLPFNALRLLGMLGNPAKRHPPPGSRRDSRSVSYTDRQSCE
jgi:hypothetical protein